MSGAKAKIVAGTSILASALILGACGATGTGGDTENQEISMECAGLAYDKVLLRTIDSGHNDRDYSTVVTALRFEGGGSGENGEISDGAKRRVVNATNEDAAEQILDEYQACFDDKT